MSTLARQINLFSTLDDVHSWATHIIGESDANILKSNNINGYALMIMAAYKQRDLNTALLKSGISLGSTVILADHILKLLPPSGIPGSLIKTPISEQTRISIVQGIEPSMVVVEMNLGKRNECVASGFFINERGQVLTNAHVVSPHLSTSLNIQFTVKNQRFRKEVKTLHVDWDRDLAVLETGLTDMPGIPCSMLAHRGCDVLCFGYPSPHNNIPNLTVSQGIISETFNLKRDENDKIVGYRFKTDAIASHGSSGGPVVGISTRKWLGVICDGEKFSFIIPSLVVAQWFDSIKVEYIWDSNE